MAKFVPQEELSLTDQMRIRREKLTQLQSEGKNPFAQTRFETNTTSEEIKITLTRWRASPFPSPDAS